MGMSVVRWRPSSLLFGGSLAKRGQPHKLSHFQLGSASCPYKLGPSNLRQILGPQPILKVTRSPTSALLPVVGGGFPY